MCNRKMRSKNTINCLIVTMCVLLTATLRGNAQPARVLVARWHPYEDRIAVTDGYAVWFYTDEFEFVSQIVLENPDDPFVGDVKRIQMEWSPKGDFIAILRQFEVWNTDLQIWRPDQNQILSQVTNDFLQMSDVSNRLEVR
jgi:hypothetical protein